MIKDSKVVDDSSTTYEGDELSTTTTTTTLEDEDEGEANARWEIEDVYDADWTLPANIPSNKKQKLLRLFKTIKTVVTSKFKCKPMMSFKRSTK